MLTEKDFMKLEKQASKLYGDLELEIIQEIAERIANVGYANTVVHNDVIILQEMGVLHQDIIEMVAKYNETSASQIKDIFETAGVNSLRRDDTIYKLAGLNPQGLNNSMMQLLSATARKTNNNLNNLTMTTASTSQMQFLDAMNKAYMEVSTGVKSYSQSIIDTINNIGNQGIQIQYPSGAKRSLESAVRTNILTSINQTSGKLQEMRAEEMGWDLVEVSAHGGARPEHAEWQGKVYSLKGMTKGYKILSDATGYGTVTGLCGANCRHTFFPYYKGSTKTYTNKELYDLKNEKVEYKGKQISKYDATQIQRKMEREIRQNKKDIAGLQGILTSNVNDDKLIENAKEELVNTQAKLKQNNTVLNDFVKQTGFKKDHNRLSIAKTFNARLGNNNENGIGGTGKGQFIEKIKADQIKSKLKEYEEEIRNKKIEYAVLIDKNLNIYAYTGDKTNLKISDRELKDSIITHNHPEISSFGKNDYDLLVSNPKIKELRAVDSEYTYSLTILKEFDKSYNYFYIRGADKAYKNNEEIQHCVMEELKKEGYIKYDRIRKK